MSRAAFFESSMSGVIIKTDVFSRTKKDKEQKLKEKDLIDKLDAEFSLKSAELKERLVDKLMPLVDGKTSQGVMNAYRDEIIAKGIKFTKKIRLCIGIIRIGKFILFRVPQ